MLAAARQLADRGSMVMGHADGFTPAAGGNATDYRSYRWQLMRSIAPEVANIPPRHRRSGCAAVLRLQASQTVVETLRREFEVMTFSRPQSASFPSGELVENQRRFHIMILLGRLLRLDARCWTDNRKSPGVLYGFYDRTPSVHFYERGWLA
jgi:hypothetical protein